MFYLLVICVHIVYVQINSSILHGISVAKDRAVTIKLKESRYNREGKSITFNLSGK